MIGPLLSGLSVMASRALHALHLTPAIRSHNDLRVLLYHGIGDGDEPCMTSLNDEVQERRFEAHLDWLMLRYRLVSLEEGLAAVTSGRTGDRPLACLTFDDGLRTLYTRARPILARRQIPSAVFLNTGVVGNRRLLWQHALSYVLHRHGVTSGYSFLARTVGWQEPAPATGLGVVQRCQERFGDVWRVRAIDQLVDAFGIDVESVARTEAIYLEASQIAEMAKDGFTFYSHTESHLPLAHVEHEVMQGEIDRARAALEAHQGTSSRCLSFPFGMWRDFGTAAQAYAIASGYTVLHVEDGWNPRWRVMRTNTLRRVGLGEQSDEIDLYADVEIMPLLKGPLRALAALTPSPRPAT